MSSRVEQLVVEIATMNRVDLISMLKKLNCRFKLDFTDDYLDSLSLERLRHVALAAALHADGVAAA